MSEKLNPFDFVNQINSGKENIMRDADKIVESSYVPYMTNRQLSYFPDTLHYANVMNQKSHLSNSMQFEYYLHIVRKRKRFSKWFKPENQGNIDLIKERYSCNNSRAMEILDILTDDQLDQIRESMFKGG